MEAADLLAIAGGLGLAALAARAMRARELTGAPVLARFAGGSLLLALAQGLDVALSLVTSRALSIERAGPDLLDALFWGYYLAAIGGLGLLLSTFTRRKLRLVLALAPLLLVAGPLAQIVVVLLALLVVVHAGLNHMERAHPGSLATTGGYALVFLAHAAFLLDHHPLAPRNLAGEILHLAGVALLVVVAYARRR